MIRIFQATAAFFKVLGNKEFAFTVKELRQRYNNPAEEIDIKADADKKEDTVKAAKNESPEQLQGADALSLLRALQRDARLIDFFQEDISGFSDEQVGAAVRDIHGKSAEVLARFFAIEPLRQDEEGAQIDVPAGFDSGLFTLVGSVAGKGPWKGTLVHPGWKATKNEVPMYTGTAEAAQVLSPAEVEVV